VELLVGVRARDGANTVDTYDTQRLKVNFTASSAGVSVDLLPASDSGTSDTDNLTNSNEWRFRVSGVTAGAEVILRTGNTELARGTATGTTIDLTASVASLNDGVYDVFAVQSSGGTTSDPSPSISVRRDTATPASINIAPPAIATVGKAYRYDFNNTEEGATELRFSLDSPPAGAVIDPVTGVVEWTPTAAQLGQQLLRLVTTDRAGNQRLQSFSVQVAQNPQMAIRLEMVSLQGTPLTSIAVGQTFLVNAFVKDLRSAQNAQGVFATYFDLLFDPSTVQVIGSDPITLQTPYLNRERGDTSKTSLVDEIGAFSTLTSPLGGEERLLARVQMRALQSGRIVLSTDPADDAGNTVLLYDIDTPIVGNQIEFGSASLPVTTPFDVVNDSVTVPKDSANNVLNPLANDNIVSSSDAVLTIASVGTPASGGSVQIITSGSRLQYTPKAGFSGTETIPYSVRDQYGGLKSGTITATVSAINDPPTANADNLTIAGNSTNNVLDVLANDSPGSDANDALTIQSVSTPSKGGTVTITNNGTRLTYSPKSGYTGAEQFTYTVRDKAGDQKTATVNITVTTANAPPTATNDAYTVVEDAAAANFNVVANDSTADAGETIAVSAVGTPSAGGTVQIVNGGQAISYKPAANFFGTETVTYTLRDSRGATATATVTFTVTGVNDAPVARADTVQILKGSTNSTVNVLTNDESGPRETETLTITSVTTPSAGGTATISGGTIRYTPPSATFLGTDTFSYTIRDPGGLESTATVTLQVVDYVPRKIGGEVVVKQGGSSSFPNAIKLNGSDSFGANVNLSTTPKRDGDFEFANRAPGDYVLRRESLPFLIGGQQAAQTTVKSALNAGDNLQTKFEVGPIAAKYISIRDFVGRTPRKAVLVAVQAGQSHTWLIGASDLGGVTDPNASMSADGKQITIAAQRNGQAVTATVSVEDGKVVQARGVEGQYRLLRVATSTSVVNYQPVTATPASVEGEASTVAAEGEGSARRLAAAATPVSTGALRAANTPQAVDAAMAEILPVVRRTSLIGDWLAAARANQSSSAEAVDRIMHRLRS
jgi:hypothetical protein